MKENGTERDQNIPNFLFDTDTQRDILCFDLFFNQGPFGLVILDEGYRILKVNSRLQEMLDLQIDEIRDGTLASILDAEEVLRLKSFFFNENFKYNSLIAIMSFLRRNSVETHSYTTYVKKFTNDKNNLHYCMLLFEQDFSPTGWRIERDQQLYDVMLETQEQERQNIGGLLHDSVAQLLYGIRLNLQYFLKTWPEHVAQISPIKNMLNEAISSIRDLSMDLNVSSLTDLGLKAAIESMIARLTVPDFRIAAIIRGPHDRLTFRCQLTIYRIVQELLNNSMKHSHASEVDVQIFIRKTKIAIEVRDNGQGFTLDNSEVLLEGSGLRGIMTRIKPFRGEFHLAKTAGHFNVNVTLALDHTSWKV